MALHSGVSGGGAIVKRAPSAAGRRRTRGSLVRCHAYVWSKEDLARLEALSRHPREAEPRHDPLEQPQDLSAICRQVVVDDDGGFAVSLRRAAKSDANLATRQTAAPESNDDGSHSRCQSPVQSALSPVTAVASTLIDLSL